MSRTTNTDYGSTFYDDNDFDFDALRKKIEQEYEEEQQLMSQVEKDEAEIRALQKDVSKKKSWDHSHDKWYYFGWYNSDIKSNKAKIKKDQAKIAALAKDVKSILDKIETMASNLELPCYQVDLMIHKLFDTLFSGKIDEKQLEQVTELMVEILAIVQVILGLVANDKSNYETRMSDENIACYKQNVEAAKRMLKEIENAEHSAVIINIVMKVVEAAVILAISALSGGTAGLAMGVVMASLAVSGTMDKATDALAEKIHSKIGAEVIITAATIVATAGISMGTAGIEGGMEVVMEEAVSTAADVAADAVIEETSSQVASTVANLVVETMGAQADGAATAIANAAAKKAAGEVIESSVRAATKTAVQSATRKMIAEGLVNAVRSFSNGSFEQAMRTTLEQTAREAATAVTRDAELVATLAAKNALDSATPNVIGITDQVTAKVAAETGSKTALRIVLGEDADKSVITAATRSKLGNALANGKAGAKTGAAFGIMQTNLGVDSISQIILSIDKKAKDKEWYQILMGIVAVLQALICMYAMGSSMQGTSDSKLAGATNPSSIAKLSVYTERFLGVTTATVDFVKMVMDFKQADATDEYADQEKDNMLFKQMLDSLTQNSSTVADRYGKMIQQEVSSTQALIKELAEAQHQVAKTLLETAV